MLKTSKNTLTRKKVYGLLEYMFRIDRIEPVGLSISLVLATVISGLNISFSQLDSTKNTQQLVNKNSFQIPE